MALVPLNDQEKTSYFSEGSNQSQAPQYKAIQIEGAGKSKSPFTEGEKKAAGRAVRMENAVRTINSLEDSGFNPVNFKDTMIVENAPFIPDLLENFLKSNKYQLYQRAMNDFTTSQLRDETGAVINESEEVFIQRSYVPVPGDTPDTIKAKREARRLALEAMKANAGKAYNKIKKDMLAEENIDSSSDNALDILIERSKTNKALRATLQERGLVD